MAREVATVEINEISPTFVEFFGECARAQVVLRPDKFMLFWIQSTRRGCGAPMLDAVHAWADARHLPGILVCELALVPWYQKHGWEMGRPFNEVYEMTRSARWHEK